MEHVRKVPVHPPSTSWYPCFFGWYWTPLQEYVRYQKKYNSLRGFWGPLKKLGSKCLYWSLEKPYDHAIHLFICFLRRRIHFRYQFSLIDSSNAVGALFFLRARIKKTRKNGIRSHFKRVYYMFFYIFIGTKYVSCIISINLRSERANFVKRALFKECILFIVISYL